MKHFVEYNKPDGKWGWFHFYNPTNNSFSYKTTFEDGYTTIENWLVWDFQKVVLNFLFGDDIESFNKKQYLDEINSKISYWKAVVEEDSELSSLGSYEIDPFPCVLYMLSFDKKRICSERAKKEISAITVLLFLDILIRDCKYLYVENIIYICSKLWKLAEFIYPDFNFERRQFIEYGKRKFVLSINDVPEIRKIFKKFHIMPVSTTYSICTNNLKQGIVS